MRSTSKPRNENEHPLRTYSNSPRRQHRIPTGKPPERLSNM